MGDKKKCKSKLKLGFIAEDIECISLARTAWLSNVFLGCDTVLLGQVVWDILKALLFVEKPPHPRAQC